MGVRGIVCALVVTLALVGCGGCGGGDDGVAVRRWQLTGAVVTAPGAVTLPGHLPVADRAGTYTLTARVDVPPAWRGQALTLWITDLSALAALRVDGVATPPVDPRLPGGYRAGGPLAWPIDAAATADGAVELALAIDHRWTQSGWWSSAPRLTAAGIRPASATRVHWINTYVAIAAAVSLIQLGLTSLAIYLVDRHRRAYFWFAIQLLSAAFYPAHVLGLTQRWLGVYDTPVLAAMLVSAISASVWFTHEFFELGPPSRIWAWLWGGTLVAFAALSGPFVTTPITGRLTVLVLGVMTGYQLLVCGRLAMRHPDRLTARFQLASWLALSLSMPPDMLHWFSVTTVLDGARPASLGLLSFALCLSLLLARRHILTLRAEGHQRASLDAQRAELVRLNEELRRQVMERSSQLFAALALAGGPSRPTLELREGDVVAGRYRVVKALGRGGMGTVHEVERLSDGLRFALKLTHDVHGAALARLAREAVIATRVSHPNLVSVLDVSVSEGGFLYLVMELVDGAPLSSERARWGDLAWALPVLAQIADGLVALHAAGVVHRDLKPANVLLANDGGTSTIKITDFGVSRPTAWFGSSEGSDERAAPATPPLVPLGPRSLELTGVIGGEPTPSDQVARDADSTGPTRTSAMRQPGAPGDDTGARLGALALDAGQLDASLTSDLADASPRSPALDGVVTRTGLLVGTPPYIPPEMADVGYTPLPSADVFAFGVIAFELCTGTRPFQQPPVLARLGGAPPEPPRSFASACPTAPSALAAMIDDCLSIIPTRRPTAAELAAILRVVTPKRATER